jgi:hypothetical protein
MLSVYRIAGTAQDAGQQLADLTHDIQAHGVPELQLVERLLRISTLVTSIRSNADEISRKLRDIADS